MAPLRGHQRDFLQVICNGLIRGGLRIYEVPAPDHHRIADRDTVIQRAVATPTPEEITLAKNEGSSSAHTHARSKVSRHFLESNGFTDSQIANAIGDEGAGIEGGIDLTRPVEVMSFPPPEKMTQYVKSHGFPGNWFDPLGNQTPDELGLSGEGRALASFKMPSGQGLLSCSKPIIDNWTNPNSSVSTAGGGKQLLVNDETKKLIISLNNIGRQNGL